MKSYKSGVSHKKGGRLLKIFGGLGFRLMLFNGLLVVLPIASMMVLDVYETRMLKAQEDSMIAQARVLAASLEAAVLEGHGIDRSSTQDNFTLERLAKSTMESLRSQTQTRLRVFDQTASLLADSILQKEEPIQAVSYSKRTRSDPEETQEQEPSLTFLYSLGSLPFRLWRTLNPAPDPLSGEEETGQALSENPAVRRALEGGYGAHTQVSSRQRSVTLFSAVPIGRSGTTGQQFGIVLASQSSYRTLKSLYEIRYSLFKVFLLSVAIALVLSFMLGLTISRPLRRMERMAATYIDSWGRPRGKFVPVRGTDELAALSRSLVRLGDGLGDHIRFISSFASDLSHELRNPLSSIRAASEIISMRPDLKPEELARLTGIIMRESDRIDNLVRLSKELSSLDLALGQSPRMAVDLIECLEVLDSDWELRGHLLDLDVGVTIGRQERPLILANPDYLRQACDKIIENAVSFSPSAARPRLRLLSETIKNTDYVAIVISDQGPGIEQAVLGKIFDRFYTLRRQEGHTGLGLSLAREIVEAYGGQIEVKQNLPSGTVFLLRFLRLRS